MLSLALLAAACTDDAVSVIETPEDVKVKGDLVFLSAGTTENSVSTRADGKTYYMPKDYRFVCKMYFKTDVSGEKYDLDRSQTAWMKVELDHGNSLYWNKAYSANPTESTGGPNNNGLDTYRNDYYASKFYWQNRRQHAFLAYTDLNKTAAALQSDGPVYNGNDLNFDLDSSENYIYKTGTKQDQWVDKNFTMTGDATKYSSLKAIIDKVITNYSSVVTDDFKTANADLLASSGFGYETWPSEYYRYSNNNRPVKIYACETPEAIDDDHQNLWYVLTFFDPDKRTVFTAEQGVIYSDEQHYGFEYKVRGDLLVAVKDGETYYLCDRNGDFIYDETAPRVSVFVKLAQAFEDNVEVVNTVAAKRYDLRGKNNSSFTSMSEQPDIVMAWEPDHVPTSAIMEDNRVNLYFKHQFSQVQVNIKNSADNSVRIDAGQILKVELLGVTDYGYVFPYLDTDEQGAQFVRGSAFQEVVAAEYSNTVLDDNPYGTYFKMFDRTMTQEDTEVNKYIKSYEGITYGRLQAIRITWQETGYKDPVTQADKEGIVHKATYRVPETNDQGQPLRLLERGKKYIWNMELRRGTLAVIRTEIIPWVVNTVYYEVDGSIVKTTTRQ